MRFLQIAPDGGVESNVKGFFIIEIKWLFSIVLLRFKAPHRETFHSHAFNAVTFFLTGEVKEHIYGKARCVNVFKASLKPKLTLRGCVHKVEPVKTTYALTFRGPWARTWVEYRTKDHTLVTLERGRRVVDTKSLG